MSEKPNIIFLQNDHQAYYRWGWNTGISPKRPHFKELASEGVEFNNTYCSTPLCGPTRRSLLTGVYAHNHKQYYNYSDAPYKHEVYLNTLKEAGYQNYYFGKWHAGPGNANDQNCEGYSSYGYGNPYISSVYENYLKRYGLPKANHHIRKIFEIPEFKEENGDFLKLEEGADYKCESSWCGEHAIGLTTTPKETHESFFLANLACEQLEKLAEKGDNKPFHLRVDFWGPHQPHFPTQEFLDMYKNLKIAEYPSFRDDLSGKPEFYHRERNQPIGKNNKLIIPNPIPWSEWKEIIQYCFAHISMVDAAGGKIIEKVRELGLNENTIIIWTSDHGDALATHGGHFDKGSYMSEEVMRVPLAMSWPGEIPAMQVRDEYVSNLDLPVTILDAANTEFTKNPVYGKSLLPLVKNQTNEWREDIMSETYGHGYGEELVSRMIVYKGYKYIATKNYKNELYNLEADPYELNNLINKKSYNDVIREMRTRLRNWQKYTNDPEKIS